MFYLDGKSKIEIAEEFGISRFKVARRLETALQDGLVRLEIHLPAELDAERSEALRVRYGLSHAVVFKSAHEDPDDPGLSTRRLGVVTAGLLAEIVTEGDVLGLIWGPEIDALGRELTALARCTVIQLCGVTPLRPVNADTVGAVLRAAAIGGGAAYPVYAPLLLPDSATVRMLREKPGVIEAVSQYGRVTKAVITVGVWGPRLSSVYEALSESEREEYERQGVCAEVCGYLLDAEGRSIAPELTERMIAVTFEELRRIPEVILLADGVERATATSAALKTGLFNGIVANSGIAERLLE
ncbi:sugar-binding transcriptional regulator [Streptomyces sp. NBC_01092]|uniref:sugar-binding transcriptional regulator n=1 Tax=Streptomyces sp. NBC_01092 TaxID=2903748 RepID=UPI003867F160|nr:transcriptional regulator [Streptomyces sp. NBC_01092]